MHVAFEVQRNDLRTCRSTTLPAPVDVELGPEDVVLAVEKFGLTANNVTYAVSGDLLGYWRYFPASDGWGRIPVWGFARVVRTRRHDLEPGTRIFGYLPMATHVTMRPGEVDAAGFMDVLPHRAELPAFYNRYEVVAPSQPAEQEDRYVTLRPVFVTGFLMDAWLADERCFGARTVALTSASSKTALALAFLLSRRAPRPYRIVGLTSARNAAFVRSLDCYDDVVTYDGIGAIPVDDTVVIDMAGNRDILSALHDRLGDRIAHSSRVGITHWEQAHVSLEPSAPMPGPEPALFLTFAHLEQRLGAWGESELRERLARGFDRFLDETHGGWVRVQRGRGLEDVALVYREILEGSALPNEAHVLSFT